MKYVGRKMSLEAGILPESLQTWLGNELEIRGIDAVIYTRYILSILQQDSCDLDPVDGNADCQVLQQSKQNLAVRRGRTRKIAENLHLSAARECVCQDSEERKKSAAVQCLLSVTEEDSDIKKLVDEIYLKLKEEKSRKTSPSKPAKSSQDPNEASDSDSNTEDPAERYYAAFPPLSDKTDTAPCRPQQTKGHLWAHVAQKSISKSEKLSDDSSGEDGLVCEASDVKDESDIRNSMKSDQDEVDVNQSDNKEESWKSGAAPEEGLDGKREPLKPAHKGQIHGKCSKEKGNGKVGRKVRNSSKERTSKEERVYVDKYSGSKHSYTKNDATFSKAKLGRSKSLSQEKYRSGENKENRGDERRGSPNAGRRWTDIEFPPPQFIVPKVKPSKLYKDNLLDVSTLSEGDSPRKQLGAPVNIIKEIQCKRVTNRSISFQEHKEKAEKMRDLNLLMAEGSNASYTMNQLDELEVQHIFGKDSSPSSNIPGENWLWYTEPLEALVPPSPTPSQRLYKRNGDSSEFLDVDMSHIFCLQDVPLVGTVCNMFSGNNGYLLHDQSVLPSIISAGTNKDNMNVSTEVKGESTLVHNVVGDCEYQPAFQLDRDPSVGHCSCQCDSDDDGTSYLREINLFMDNSCCSGSTSSQGSCVFTPESTENQVLDDRPVFELGPNIAEVFAQASIDNDGAPNNTNSTLDSDSEGNVCQIFPHKEPAPMSELFTDPDENDNTSLVSQLLLSIQTDVWPPPDSCDEDTLAASFSSATWQSETSDMEQSFDSLCGRIHSLCLKELSDSASSDVLRSPELKLLNCDSCVSNNNFNSDFYLGSGSCAWTFFSGTLKTSIWSAYLDCESPAFEGSYGFSWQKFQSTNTTFDDDRPWEFFSSPLTLHLSPKTSGAQTSHLWDVNVQKKVAVMTPECQGELSSTTENIHKYLWNLRFGFSGDAGFSQNHDFIRGGLYGNCLLGLQDSIWDNSKSTSPRKSILPGEGFEDNVFNDPDDADHLWDNFSSHPLFFKQRSTSADHVDDDNFAGLQRFARSVEILPSANSAFKDLIPTRLPHLPHVQSEPILSLQHMFHHECQGRMVQVKHLYKSESSILKQLGLASGGHEPEKSEVKYSPDTHFRPINSPTKASSDPSGSDTGNLASSQVALNIFSVHVPTPDVAASNLLYGRCSKYQVYQGIETEYEDNKTFVPRFLLRKGLEKYIQTEVPCLSENLEQVTELDEEELDEEEEIDEDDEKTEEIEEEKMEEKIEEKMEEKMEEDGKIEEEDKIEEEEEVAVEEQDLPLSGSESSEPSVISESHDSSLPSPKETNNSIEHTLELLLTDVQDMLQLDKEEAQKFVIEDMHNYELYAESPQSGQENSSDYESFTHDVSTEDLNNSSLADLWNEEIVCNVTNTQQPQAPQACPSIYKSIWSCGTEHDIPSLPSSYKAGAEALGASYHGSEQWHPGEMGTWTCNPTVLGNQKAEDLEKKWLRKNDSFTNEDSGDEVFVSQVSHDQVLYSTDLEQRWLDSDSLVEFQVPKMRIKDKKANLRKPCSFFLEGNCRRTDCKFAHDMSSITCRFWEEDECFKGMTCPFLHGYYRDSPTPEGKSSDSEYQLDLDDFPDLSHSLLTDEDSPGSDCTTPVTVNLQRKSESEKYKLSASRKKSDKEKKRSKSMITDSKSKAK